MEEAKSVWECWRDQFAPVNYGCDLGDAERYYYVGRCGAQGRRPLIFHPAEVVKNLKENGAVILGQSSEFTIIYPGLSAGM